MMNVDPSRLDSHKKRSSLKVKNLFPEGMTYDDYMTNKSKKLQWDTKVEEIETIKKETDQLDTAIKFKEAKAHFQDVVSIN